MLAADPLTVTEEAMSAAAMRPIVTALMRFGVSHVRCRAASQERTPVAPVAAAITHPAHIDPRIRKKQPSRAQVDVAVSLPGVAEAHGTVDPIATSYLARIA